MMKNTINPPYRKLKLLLILPIMAGVFYAFATPEYKYVQAEKNTIAGIQDAAPVTENVPIEVQDTVKSSVTTLEGNFVASSPMDTNSPVSGFKFSAKKIQGQYGKGTEIVNGEDISLDLGNTTSTIFIDGKEATKAEFDKLDPNTIASVSVLKGESATSKYGDKGKNGVILITLKKDESNAHTQVEQMPEFPGGEKAMNAFIASTMKYPVNDLEYGIQGRIYVKFLVDRTGQVTNIKVSRGVNTSLDNEAMRIVQSMPKWNPGKQNGENVAVTMEIGINFKLPDDWKIRKEKLRISYQTNIKPEDQAAETKRLIYDGIAGNGKSRYKLENSDYTGEVEVSIIDKDGKLVSKEIKNGPSFILDYKGMNGYFTIYTKVGSIQYIGYMSVSNTIFTKSKPNKKAEVKPAVNQAAQVHELIIVPNPTSDKATITLKDSDYTGKLQVSVYDKDGKLIRKETKTGPTFNLSFASYTSGNYFIVVKAGNNHHSGHLVVNH